MNTNESIENQNTRALSKRLRYLAKATGTLAFALLLTVTNSEVGSHILFDLRRGNVPLRDMIATLSLFFSAIAVATAGLGAAMLVTPSIAALKNGEENVAGRFVGIGMTAGTLGFITFLWFFSPVGILALAVSIVGMCIIHAIGTGRIRFPRSVP